MDQRPQEAVAAVRQGNAQTPDPLTTARLRIAQQTQALEIHLGHLAGWRRRHTHRIAASTARFEAQAPDEAFQGWCTGRACRAGPVALARASTASAPPAARW